MMSLWDALRMNMMISYQELVRTFPRTLASAKKVWMDRENIVKHIILFSIACAFSTFMPLPLLF